MGQGERNFELYKAFDDRMKKEYGYVFYPEAYAELQALCNDCFPTTRRFMRKRRNMNKTLCNWMERISRKRSSLIISNVVRSRQKRMRVIYARDL